MGSNAKVLWSDVNLWQVSGDPVSFNPLNMNMCLTFELVIGGETHSDFEKQKVVTIRAKMKSSC